MIVLEVIGAILIGIGVLFISLIGVGGISAINITKLSETFSKLDKSFLIGLGIVLVGIIVMWLGSINWNLNFEWRWKNKKDGENS